ncbi:MAG: sulfocyanin-like copper-binding protein [Dermatophilaceae bacterium]
MRRPVMVGALATAVIALVASAAVAVGVIGPSSGPSSLRGGVQPGGFGFLSGSSRAAPKLPGTVVNVALTNMGGPMMAQSNGMMGQGSGRMNGGGMRLSADHATAPHGTVSFLVSNSGSINHEMVVLPLLSSRAVGARPIGGGARIDEAGSLGEASKTGGAGAGEGIVPGASGWVTVTLAPGQYELVCNLAGHYAAGMYTQLTVT